MSAAEAGDLILLRGLRVLAVCGVLAQEQAAPQPFEIDLDVEADLARAGASDELADTVDYGALCDRVQAVAASGRFALLERFATVVADEALAEPGVEAVTVSIRKLRPPVPQQLATSGVRLRRTRGGSSPR